MPTLLDPTNNPLLKKSGLPTAPPASGTPTLPVKPSNVLPEGETAAVGIYQPGIGSTLPTSNPNNVTPSADMSTKITPTPAAVTPVKPPMTIDSAVKNPSVVNQQPLPGDKPVNGLPTAKPALISDLNPNDQARIDQEVQTEIDTYTKQSEAEIQKIRDIGSGKLGASRDFLASIGALGRSLSGTPVETGLGVLSNVQASIDKAIAEERTNLQGKIASAKSGGKLQAQKRVDELNKLSQQNFDNAVRLVNESTQLSQEERAKKIGDLNNDNLERTIANGKLEDVMAQIDRMAGSKTPISQFTAEQIATFEKDLGLAPGTFNQYYTARQELASFASTEAQAKVDKLKQDIESAKALADSRSEETLLVKAGGSYISTPAERDRLIALGREVRTLVNGKSYLMPLNIKSAGKNSTLYDAGGQKAPGITTKPTTSTTKTSTTSTKLTSEEKAFQTKLNSVKTSLAKGGSWASAWDTIWNIYSNDLINAYGSELEAQKALDQTLNKDKYYSQTGVKAKTPAATKGPVTFTTKKQGE